MKDLVVAFLKIHFAFIDHYPVFLRITKINESSLHCFHHGLPQSISLLEDWKRSVLRVGIDYDCEMVVGSLARILFLDMDDLRVNFVASCNLLPVEAAFEIVCKIRGLVAFTYILPLSLT